MFINDCGYVMPEFFNVTDINVVMQCDHCGNRASFIIRADYTDLRDAADGYHYTEKTLTTWYIMQCQTCFRPTFAESSKIVNGDLNKMIVGPFTAILYPAERTLLADLPEAIEKKYKEALLVRNISPSSCAVLVRKILEAICEHENAQGRVLAEKLRDLANSGRIPQTLADVATHLKQLGNLGAHINEDDVTQEDVPVILDFVELLLDYLYVAPMKIEAVRRRLGR